MVALDLVRIVLPFGLYLWEVERENGRQASRYCGWIPTSFTTLP